MRTQFTLLCAILSCINTVNSYADYLEECSASFFAGYRQDSLNWNIAGPHNKPDVLSELKWENLRMPEIGLYLEATILDNWMICAEGDYAKILKGTVRDCDYDRNGRRGEVSRFNCDASRGEAFDISGAAGYVFDGFCYPIKLVPIAGYSYHEQHLQMYDGHIVIFDGHSIDSYVSDLHSNYRTRWHGPFLGADILYQWNCSLDLYLNAEYHWLTFNGKGHWNLRSEFYDDFQHKSYGNGFSGSLGANYAISCDWSAGLCVSYYNYHVRRGRDRTFIKEDLFDSSNSKIGSEYIKMETRLNEVNWHSFRAEAVLTYQF